MISRLAATNFRNLEPFAWDLEPGSHLLLGENGAGKTSLLEAAYVASTTRSFRSARIADCRRLGSDRFELLAEAGEAGRIRLSVSWYEGNRHRAVNGSHTHLAEHLGVQPIVAWTAADVEAIKGEPKLRRRLLDRGVVSLRPGALDAITRYSRIAAEKRAALLRGEEDLAVWNILLAQVGSAILLLRLAYFDQLRAAFLRQLTESGIDLPEVDLEYRSSPRVTAETAEEALLRALSEAEPVERRRGMLLVGPHRDDLVLTLRRREVRHIASAGERRALGMLLAAAHGDVLEAAGLSPIYLLDDADAELSRRNLEQIWDRFHHRTQVIVSSSRPTVWKELPLDHRWEVSKGNLRAH